ncbi:hypothetical protein ACIBL8_47725 [Streptomyces sp. NPDC050523]|uniref:hypothetical protein n=1 Tax=Streptomyces sp. NPDC050523 TaxID=3365622 RepID=UPI0037B1F00E
MADLARMGQDLGPLRPGDEIAVDLRTLTARRLDLVNPHPPDQGDAAGRLGKA